MAADFNAKTAELAERFRRGDEDTVAEILGTLGPAIRTWLRRNFGALLVRDEIDQIVLDTLMDAWRGRAKCGRGNFVGWLFKIAYHAAIHFLRSISIDGERPVQFPDPDLILCVVDHRNGEECNDLSKDSQADDFIRLAMAGLPARQREVMLSDYWLGGVFTDQELALKFGVAESTIRSYRMRAKTKLREALSDLGVERFLRVQRDALYISRKRFSAPPSPKESSDFGTGNGERGTGS